MLAIDKAGDVWSWGKCHFGQLGHGRVRFSCMFVHTPSVFVGVCAGECARVLCVRADLSLCLPACPQCSYVFFACLLFLTSFF